METEKYLKRIATLKTAAECEAFIKNATRLDRGDLVEVAIRRKVELGASAVGGTTAAELEGWKAINAYEETLFRRHGKKTKASRTRQMISRLGMVPSIEKIVCEREWDTQGAMALYQVGLGDYTFEAIVTRYPGEFSDSALAQAELKLEKAKLIQLGDT